MDENESKSPWDDLVGELGIDPTPDSFERKQAPATEIPPVAAEKDNEAYESQKATPSDWTGLADSLGIEVEDEPENELSDSAEIPQEEAVSDVVAEAPSISEEPTFEEISDSSNLETLETPLPPLPSEIDKVMDQSDWSEDSSEVINDTHADEVDELQGDSEGDEEDEQGMSGEDARNAFDALFTAGGSAWAVQDSEVETESDEPLKDFSDPFGFEVKPAPESEEDSEEEEEDRRPRRRRRRRRGRGKKTNEENTISEVEEDIDSSLSEDLATADEADEKPHRRRSRRRGRRSSKPDPSAEEKRLSSDNTDDQDDDLSEAFDDGVRDTDSGRRSSSRSRSAHRNLPTWAEAIGGIVDANLEQRSKSPNKSTSSRGRGRGGRRRSKKN